MTFRMRIRKQLLWLLVVVTALVALAPLGQITAQGDRYELLLSVLPGYYYREITPGEENTLYLEIRNTGNQPITDIGLISDHPEGWDVGVRPDSVDYLGADSSQTIDLSVMAPTGTERGEYTLTLIAEASQTRTATSMVLRVESSSSFWLWIGGGVAALVIAAFVFIFLRFGRD
ncbi:NEW3 domain-containing protein [Chloroflexota bacterium]